VSVALAVTVGLLVAVGMFMILQRTLTRIVIGLGVLGHGVNLLLIAAGGRAGVAPFVGDDGADAAGAADPLAQALVLTAIVIGFGMTGLLLTMAYRSWQLTHNDEVEDDLEDRRIAQSALDQEDIDP
jgi:multicomponent Na+:H+ antiporter subunit C